MGGHRLALDWFVCHGIVRKAAPRVCYVPTAGGDDESAVSGFLGQLSRFGCRIGVLRLFRRDDRDLSDLLLSQDVIYVGGGNTANMLAIWRLHGVDKILRQAWENGVVLAGFSAGSLCWFEGGTTDSFGPIAVLNDGLGLLKGSNSPHYDTEPSRRPVYQELVRSGKLPDGIAADDDVALVYHGTEYAGALSTDGGSAWQVRRNPDGKVEETRLLTLAFEE